MKYSDNDALVSLPHESSNNIGLTFSDVMDSMRSGTLSQTSYVSDIITDSDFNYYEFTLESILKAGLSGNQVSSSIQDLIKITLDAATSDWRGKLIFECRSEDEESFSNQDILRYVGKNPELTEFSRLYFSNNKYPIDGKFEGEGFNLLVNDLQKAAITTGGYELNRNGKFRHKSDDKGCYRLSCYRCQPYRGNRVSRSKLSFRKTSFTNDRLNNRPSGKSLPRRTKTRKAILNTGTCRFHIAIHCDSHCFYVLPKKGKPHSYKSPTITQVRKTHSC